MAGSQEAQPAGLDIDCVDELNRLLLLLLGSAVQCERKEVFVSRLQQLPEAVQMEICLAIKEVLDNADAVWLKQEWREGKSLLCTAASGDKRLNARFD